MRLRGIEFRAAAAEARPALVCEGAETERIALRANDLAAAKTPICAGAEVASGAIVAAS